MAISANSKNLKTLYTSTAFMAALAFASSAHAGVVEGSFAEGSGTFTQTANKTTITLHSANSITNFTDFNIAAGQEVLYNNDIGTRATNLSRVQNAASIYGKLTTDNVNLFLVSPNGVIFGKGSEVNAPNLVVSTSDIADANFRAGNYKFDIKSQNANASIINQGNITIADGGLAAFVAPSVANEGFIIANRGTVTLAAGDEFTLDFYGDKMINFAVSQDEKDRLVKQSGTIAAAEGKVILTVQDAQKVVNNVVNMDGVTEAKDVSVSGDRIFLGGSNKIKSNGGNVILVAKSSIVADGEITNSMGFVETSGGIFIRGGNLSVDTTDILGNAGMWLIDPTNFTISSAKDSANNYNNTTLSNDLAKSNISISTSNSGGQDGDITISASVQKTSGASRNLTLNAHDDITLNSGVTIASTSNALDIILNANGNISINGTISTNGGNFSASDKTGVKNANSFLASNTATINTAGGDIKIWANTITNDTALTTSGKGSVSLRGNDININKQITSGGDTDLDITTGVLKINAKITSGDDINIKASKGAYVELGEVLSASDNITSSGVDRVDVTSTKAIINQGIIIVDAGGTVNVKAGTYNQSVVVDKAITLNGDGATTIIAPTSNPAVEGENSTLSRPIIWINNADATVSNLTIDGAGVGTGLGKGEYIAGIFIDNSAATIDGVTIKNISNPTGASTGILAYNADSSSIKNSTFSNNNTDVLITNGTTKLTFSGDTFTGSTTGIKVNDSKSSFSFSGANNAFSGNQTYIDLQNSAMDNTTIDATAVKFEGKLGSAMTNDELIAIENKVHHEADDLTLGRIIWKAGTFVAATGGGLQVAIDSTSAGGTVLVSDGIYDEGVTINKNLTITGDSDGGAIVRPSSASKLHSFVSSYDANENNAAIVLAQGATVNISNLEVDGSKAQTGFAKNTRAVGIGYDNAGGTLSNVTIHDISDDQLNRGIGIFADVNSLIASGKSSGDTARTFNISGSKIYAYQVTGVQTNGDLITTTISGNTVTGRGASSKLAQTGISATRGANATISGNTVSNNTFTGSIDISVSSGKSGAQVTNNTLSGGTASSTNTGILVANTNNVTISGNTIANRGTGIRVDNGSGAALSSNKVSGATTGVALNTTAGTTVSGDEYSANTSGLVATSTKTLTITKSNVHDNTGTGVEIASGSGASINGGSFYSNTTGIYANGSNGLVVDGADVYSNTTGIKFANVTGGTVKNSDIHDNTTGVSIDSSDLITVSGNDFESNTTGVYVSESGNSEGEITIADNYFYDHETGVDIENSSYVNVEDENNFESNGTGVYIGNSDNILVADNSFDSNDTGVQVEDSEIQIEVFENEGGITISGNDFFDNEIGVSVLNTSKNVSIADNSFEDNSRGVYASNSANLTISDDSFSGNTTGVELTNGASAVISGTGIDGGTTGLIVTGADSFVSFSGSENSFSNQEGQYISIEDNAMFGDILDVSAIVFDEVLASLATDSESFAIEDKIRHKMDDDNVGLAMWRENNLFATLNNRGIQAGIDIADNGWTVNIGNGNFNENLFLNKGVNLIGRGSEEGTTVNGGSDIALEINTNESLLVQGINFTTGFGEEESIAQFAVVVDGSHLEKGEEEFFTVNGPINVSFDDILFGGVQDQAALDFRNATTFGGSVNNVVFNSTAANAWLFENVSGGEPSDEFGEGDINFGNTYFGGSYEVADIHLINSLLDGNVEDAVFSTAGEDSFAIENRLIHDYDLPELGTIFYTGIDEVYAAREEGPGGLGALARFLSEITNINDPYFHPLSNAGRIFGGPNLGDGGNAQFNTGNDPKVRLSGFGNNNQGGGNFQNLNPASGNDLNNLNSGSGGNGGDQNNNDNDCGVSFGNNFLGDDVPLANSDGSCKVGA